MLLVSAAAITNPSGQVFVQKRPEGKNLAGMWEFPGGKVESDETPEQGLIRELHEEIGINVPFLHPTPLNFMAKRIRPSTNTDDDLRYQMGYPALDSIVLLLYHITLWKGIITPMEKQECRWVYGSELQDLAMPDTNRPLIEIICEQNIVKMRQHAIA